MTFLAVLVLMSFVVMGLGIKWVLQNKAMNAGCSKDPIIVNGKKLDCMGCPEEKQKECALKADELSQA